MRPEKKYYVTGGSLRADTPSYVARKADEELFLALLGGEFCYVLTSRQMGKTSLIVRTAARLCAENVRVAVLDLTAIGQNVQPEQWYYGLLCRLGEQLHLEDELDEFWEAHDKLGPLQRWVAAIREVALLSAAQPFVIFIDEIDAVRSLPIATGEFFAAIRECYNRRTQNAEFEKLTFCLMGVASPTDLIRDTRTTPFNIGRRIELTDFTEEESTPLEGGLGGVSPDNAAGFTERPAKRLLRRILHWTGGHPYLTQRFCKAVADNAEIQTDSDIDRLCHALFLSPGAQERDDNLVFVRDRILRSEADHVALIDMYSQVLAGKKIKNDESNPLVSILRLSGIVKAKNGRLAVRNRIYADVFDREWTLSNTPYAEVLRQEKAYRRGALRTAAVFGLLIAVIGSLSFAAVRNAHRAERNAYAARRAETNAIRAADKAGRLLYIADLTLIQSEWDANNIGHVLDLLEETRSNPERNFEWDYWNRAVHRSIFTKHILDTGAIGADLSPDGRQLAIYNRDVKRQIAVYNLASGATPRLYDIGSHILHKIQFMRDGKHLIFRDYEYEYQYLDLATGRITPGPKRVAKTKNPDPFFLSPDSSRIVCVTDGGQVYVMDLWNGKRALNINLPAAALIAAWNKSGKAVFIGDMKGNITLRDADTGRERLQFFAGTGMNLLALAPNGTTLAVGYRNGRIELRDANTGRLLHSLLGHTQYGLILKFSPDGTALATGGMDGAAIVYDTRNGSIRVMLKDTIAPLTGVFWENEGRALLVTDRAGDVKRYTGLERNPGILHQGGPRFWRLGVSTDGGRVVVGGADGAAHIYDTRSGKEVMALGGSGGNVFAAAYSRDENRIATGGSDHIARVWDARTGRFLLALRGHSAVINALAFSPDSKTVATASDDRTAVLWDAQTGRKIRVFAGHIKSVEILAFTPDGAKLVTGSDDDTAVVWDIATGKRLLSVKNPREVWGLAVFPDGKHLVTTNLNNTAQVWDMETGQLLKTLIGHTDWLIGVAVSLDGKRIVTGSKDTTAKVWDAETGRELLTLKGHTAQIVGVAFTPYSKRILTAGGDGSVRVWSGE